MDKGAFIALILFVGVMGALLIAQLEEKKRREMRAQRDLVKRKKRPARKHMIRRLMRKDGVLEIEYVDEIGNKTRRSIEPYYVEGNIVESFCRKRGEDRTFRIDRIRYFISPYGEVIENPYFCGRKVRNVEE